MRHDSGFTIQAAESRQFAIRGITGALRQFCFTLFSGVIALIFLAGFAVAEPIYMWHDDQGQVHLSDRPPPAGTDYKTWSDRTQWPQDTDQTSPRSLQTAPPSLQRVPPNAGLFWQIVHPNQRTSYLLGTIHSDDQRVMRLPESVRLAFRRSERFVMEVKVDESILFSMTTRMIMLDGSNLINLLGEKDFNKVVRAMAPHGVPAEVLQMMKPWAVMAFISTPRPKSNRFLDLKLQQEAAAQKKEISGLETIDEQLAAFDDLSMADQVDLLKATLRQLPDLPDYFERLIRAYARDDLGAIARLSQEYQKKSGSREVVDRFMQQLNDRRNDRMVRRMMPYLKAGNSFVAVGALHLAGGRGILAQLTERGYAVIPVRK